MAVDLHRDWLTAAEIAELRLPGLPARRDSVARLAARRGWDRTDLSRKRGARGGPREYHIDLPPEGARADLEARRAAAAQKPGTPPESLRVSDPQGAPLPSHVRIRRYGKIRELERVFAASIGPDAYFQHLRDLGYETKDR